MLDRFSDRTLEIATVVVVILIALVILCYAAIFINPQVVFNPFPPDTAVPTLLAQAPLAPTWTPTPTSTPTSTASPTPTWTPSMTPSSTPTPIDTSTPTPTNTATPTPTNTPAPTKRPKPRPPTATPTPFPYSYILAQGGPDCARTWVWGYVVAANGLPEANVQMRVGNDQGWRADTWTDGNGKYAFEFAGEPIAGKFFVRVFKGGHARSDYFWFASGGGCDGPYSKQQFRIDWQHR
jgi:hypothetical protein